MLRESDALGEGDGLLGVGDPDMVESRLMVRSRSDDFETGFGIEEKDDLSP